MFRFAKISWIIIIQYSQLFKKGPSGPRTLNFRQFTGNRLICPEKDRQVEDLPGE